MTAKNLDAEHLRWAIHMTDLSQTEFAERIGVSKQAINNILAGRSHLSRQTAERIAVEFNISLAWLLTGLGSSNQEGTTTPAPKLEYAEVAYTSRMENIPLCTHCKKRVDREDKFCRSCGVELLWVERGQSRARQVRIERPGYYCEACDGRIPPKAARCPHCRSPLIWPDADKPN